MEFELKCARSESHRIKTEIFLSFLHNTITTFLSIYLLRRTCGTEFGCFFFFVQNWDNLLYLWSIIRFSSRQRCCPFHFIIWRASWNQFNWIEHYMIDLYALLFRWFFFFCVVDRTHKSHNDRPKRKKRKNDKRELKPKWQKERKK